MNIADALILGIIQGLTEFLPISSSGHLLLLERLGIGEPSLLFNVLLHFGSLIAVIIVFFKPIKDLVRHPFQKKLLFIVIATIPTVAIGILFKFLAPHLLDGAYLASGFMLTACLLFSTKLFERKNTVFLDKKISFVSGVVQGIAVLPGISRSGATISSLMLLGVDKKEAFEFSFLLSVPIIIGSAALEIGEMTILGGAQNIGAAAISVGMTTSFLSGLFSLLFFKKLIKTRSLLPFAVYTALLSILTLILQGFGY